MQGRRTAIYRGKGWDWTEYRKHPHTLVAEGGRSIAKGGRFIFILTLAGLSDGLCFLCSLFFSF